MATFSSLGKLWTISLFYITYVYNGKVRRLLSHEKCNFIKSYLGKL